MAYLRLIGDVHGKFDEYIATASQAEYSIQLGDLGFNYEPLKVLDPSKHRVIGGNHDNYEWSDTEGFIHQSDHFLGEYGVHNVPGVSQFFYLRGGRSIDRKKRVEGRSWWPKEEISYAEGMKALEKYKEIKSEVVLSHECPSSIIDMLAGTKTWDGVPIRPSMTAELLQNFYEAHQPKLWVFGHHHLWFDQILETGTRFICLPELAFLDIELSDFHEEET